MRRTFLCDLLLLLAATSAMGQVEVELRFEKARYLAGEPIVVVHVDGSKLITVGPPTAWPRGPWANPTGGT